jgi:predicted Holliday junction resolvase-like endonuclease
MLESLKAAWAANKPKVILVAVPLVLLLLAALFLKGYRSWLLSSAVKLLGKAEKKDAELKAEADEANKKAEEHKMKAEEIEKKVEEVKKDDDADWHKRQS